MVKLPCCLSQLNQGFLLLVTKDTVTNTTINPYTDQFSMWLPSANHELTFSNSFFFLQKQHLELLKEEKFKRGAKSLRLLIRERVWSCLNESWTNSTLKEVIIVCKQRQPAGGKRTIAQKVRKTSPTDAELPEGKRLMEGVLSPIKYLDF